MSKQKPKHPIEIAIGFIHRMVSDLLVLGAIALLTAVLTFMFPEFLRVLVGVLLVLLAIWAFNMAYKVNKFSKIRFNL